VTNEKMGMKLKGEKERKGKKLQDVIWVENTEGFIYRMLKHPMKNR